MAHVVGHHVHGGEQCRTSVQQRVLSVYPSVSPLALPSQVDYCFSHLRPMPTPVVRMSTTMLTREQCLVTLLTWEQWRWQMLVDWRMKPIYYHRQSRLHWPRLLLIRHAHNHKLHQRSVILNDQGHPLLIIWGRKTCFRNAESPYPPSDEVSR